MRVAVLQNTPDLSAYLGEMLKTWGLPLYEALAPDKVADLNPAQTPVLICPASTMARATDESVLRYVAQGGTAICMLPSAEVATAAGLEPGEPRDFPLRLRITGPLLAGLAGQSLPVVGEARTYQQDPEAAAMGYLYRPGHFEGESVGMAESRVGRGTLVAIGFDLPLCVLMLRQGDPSRAEVIPGADRCARPSHLASDYGPRDSGWVPFADLLARAFVELVRRHLPAPVPGLWHLPGSHPGILLYSGDEDGAEVAWNDEELDWVAAAGARMNLYIIPIQTKSTRADARRYAAHHDLGPHPQLVAFYESPVAERVAELERQIRMFQDMFDMPVRSVRNHSTAWAGYLEPVEAMERLGVRMDANYFSGTYKRDRDHAPYTAFGSAAPMRFCRPDGRLLSVFQQHTHLSDDAMFSLRDYSYKFSPEQYAEVLDRVLADAVTRFHVPHAVCIHPSNWVKFSRVQGQALVRQALKRDLPVWSFDQWLGFWEARDTWRFDRLRWDGSGLECIAEGETAREDLCLTLPPHFRGEALAEVRLNGEPTDCRTVSRYGRALTFVPLPAGERTVKVRATYRGDRRAPAQT